MSRKRLQPPGYWFDGSRPPLPARLLAEAYAGAVASRRWLYDKGLLRRGGVDRPVIVVGNLIAGGSGKTPLVIALVERLRAAGRTPGVASRGYGRAQAEDALWVDAGTDPRRGGDEPVLIARRTGAKVRVDRDRLAAARALVAAGCDVVVCDDGLQHYRLRRDLEIEVIDGRRRYGNGLLLPAGPLREPAGRGGDCQFRVVNLGADEVGEAGFGEWSMRLRVDRAQPLQGGRPCPLRTFSGQRVHAVAGIGDPERFFATLREHGIAVVPHAFADHHRYVADDLRFGSDLPVLMTEKDAVKCLPFAGERHFSVPATAELPEAFWIALLDRLSHL
ncbi:tetraacyldisaccharide 4'-kinase [Luteimonas salinilitoris]|uniref:Tetraacyldisaccharide 4'-kinase n=1 Tax=Luteimonas salinilitoris TaxID=3237697 RepID=A0ABV4HVK5_9GAMM